MIDVIFIRSACAYVCHVLYFSITSCQYNNNLKYTTMRIIIPLNAEQHHVPVIDFGCRFARLAGTQLTGVFLQSMESEAAHQLDSPGTNGARLRGKLSHENIEHFKNACDVRDTECKIHRDRGIPFDELILESRFADVMILDPSLSFSEDRTAVPSTLVKRILKNAECPIILAPESHANIEQIVFAYDAKPESLFAIKQFTYLFPQYRATTLTVVEVHTNSTEISRQQLLKEWLNDHYANVSFNTMQGDDYNRLLEIALSKDDCLLVMGAYGRGWLSELLKQSHADTIIKLVSRPIFIAHR